MKKIVLFICTFPLLLCAQKDYLKYSEVELGKTYIKEPSFEYQDNSKNLYVIHPKQKGFTIDKFDSSLIQTYTKTIKFNSLIPEHKGVIAIEYIEFDSASMHVMLSEYIKAEKKQVILSLRFDLNGEFQHELETLDETEHIEKSDRYFTSLYNADTKHTLYLTKLKNTKNLEYTMYAKLYNPGRKLVWEKEIKITESPKNIYLSQFMLDNQNNLIFTIRELADKNETQKCWSSILVYYFNGFTNELKSSRIGFDNKFIFDAKMVSLGDTMKIIGTYGDSNYKIYNDHYRHLQGTFTTSYDLKTIKDLGTVTSSIKKFGFPPYIDDDQLYDLKISTLQNGDYILSMEQRIFKPSQFYLVYGPYMSGYGTERQYVANSIFIAGMSKNGDLKWVSGIPKNQIEEQNSRFISHFSFVQDNRFFVVYNSSNKISKPFNPINSGQFEIIISEFDAMGMSKTYRLNNPFNGVACINKSIYSGENKSLYLIVSSLATYTSYNYIKLANIDMRNLGK